MQEAERLGYDSVWTAEAYGSDAATVLAWLAGQHEQDQARLGDLPDAGPQRRHDRDDRGDDRRALRRPDAARDRLSGPQVAEGWHGQRFGRQLQRTRDTWRSSAWPGARAARFHGETLELPLPDGPGKALKLTITPVQERIPIYLPRSGPRTWRWPARSPTAGSRPSSPPSTCPIRWPARGGRARSGRSLEGFDIAPTVNAYVSDDREAARNLIRPVLALYIGGMGSREQNFYNKLVQRYGFEAAATEIQDLYLDGKKEEAGAALPDELIDMVSLCGPRDVVRDRLAAFRDAGVGTLMITPMAFTGDDRIEQLRARSPSWPAEPGTLDSSSALSATRATRSRCSRSVRVLAGRGHDVMLETWARWREHVEAAGMRFVAAPEYPVFPPASDRSTLRGRRPRHAQTRAAVARRPDVVAHDILTLAPALAAELEGVPAATLVPHIYPVGAPGFPPYALGARLPRTRRARCGMLLEPSSRPGCAAARESSTNRAKLGLPPVQRLYGGISDACAWSGRSPAGVPAHGRPRFMSSGPLLWEPPYHTVRGAARDAPLVLVAPSTAQDPEHRLLRGRRRASPMSRSGCSPPGTASHRRPGHRPREHAAGRLAVLLPDDASSAPWRSATPATAPSREPWPCGCPVLCRAPRGDMAENAARADWAGVGVRLPWRLLGPTTLRLAVRRALANPSLTARAR